MLNGFEFSLFFKLPPIKMEVVVELFFIWSASDSSDLPSLDSIHIDLKVTLNWNRLHFLIHCEVSKVSSEKLLSRASLIKTF